MAIELGPKLGLLYNTNIYESYGDAFRPFLQAIDALLFASVINATTIVPPTSPNNGDAYLLVNTPAGAWLGQQNAIAVWSTGVTLSGTNTPAPAWVFYTPKPGWTVWNTATAQVLTWNGTVWGVVGIALPLAVADGGTGATTAPAARTNLGAAASGANTDITGLGAITCGPTTSGPVGIQVTSSDPSNGGYALYTTNGTDVAYLTTNGTMQCTSVSSNGYFGGAGFICTGTIQCALYVGNSTTTGILVQGGSGSPTALVCAGGLLGFTSCPVQTTVGAAGSASALPSLPTGYLPISINGTVYVIPYYHN
jgi:hypothetical protein